MAELIDKRIGNEVDGSVISNVFEGYTFKITGGYDKDGFAMKNGILTQGKRRILLHKGCTMFRFKKGYHRRGVRERKLVRGCIVSHDIKVLHLKVVKRGANPIPGLTEAGCEEAKRLGPKRATRILKQFGLTEIYNKKKQDKNERKNIRYMITKFAPKRTVTTKNGKTYVKAAKIQRLVTPERLRRKRLLKVIKEDRVKAAKEQRASYHKLLKDIYGKKGKKTTKKN